MSLNINRRKFLRNSSLLTSSFFVQPFISQNFFSKEFLPEPYVQDPTIEDFIHPNHLFVDSTKNDEILIQAYDFQLGGDFNFKNVGQKKIVVYCYNLMVNGQFENFGGSVFISCRNINCINDAKILVNGFSAADAGKESQTCTGESPNGENANNLNVDGSTIKLDGTDGGNIVLYFENLKGNLYLDVSGGKGGKGEDGADACDGRDGRNGPNGSRTCPPRAAGGGESGFPPGINGDGAPGGKGGNAGKIYIYGSEKAIKDRKNSEVGKDVFPFSNGSVLCLYSGGSGGLG